MPGVHVPDVGSNLWDKLVHFMAYAIFTFLLLKGFYEMPEIKNYLLITAVISLGYGASLEFLQALVPGRGVDILDLTANTLGCIASLVIFPFIGKRD
ncbi:MAG: VanZ family protein [Candidatus Cyclobacteriaceae bacterium M2_1C_046]